MMHHQYKPNNLERLYGAQHYTYGYKVQLLLRAVVRLGRYQGVLSPQKGHLGPKTGFPPLAPTLCAYFGIIYPFECVLGHKPPQLGHFPMS